MKTIESSTGGTIQITARGLIHKAGTGAYSGRIAEMNGEVKVVAVDAVKRGRGRPKFVNSTNGSYDFSAFQTPVKLSKFEGNVTRVKAKV